PEGRPPLARWIEPVADQDQRDFRVAVSPISAADELRESLWERCAGALITSATLTSLGRFDRLLGKLGLDEERAVCHRLPSPFDYGRAALCLPGSDFPDPRDAEAHTRAVAGLLAHHLDPAQGSLVLFTSRRHMEAAYAQLPPEWQGRTRCQGTVSRERLLAEHEAEIEAGRGSVLFGLASFAEGVDLPGALCRHVVIVRLPFSVPTTPVEATTHEWVESRGGKPFFEISLPDASLRLIQAVGRLIRNEDDWGTVTILDPRVTTKPYGRELLDSLPPIPRQTLQPPS
ncbi:MAG TPA: helicase C-terminal domain-containing protein, partial [Gammaproteobacteria bacterium]|nr:helicase C-terminal domain-containing protein [Gammaproteobacteria bacterium]